ncbi:MAG TPA: hypothetical protein VGV35_04485, partial [Bryobacteraceae bacterium]|nr:hypothetical protein [Bryobacteraceae bacterium]
AWPIALIAKVVDDCGNAMVTGSVNASFSNGDAPLSLVSLKDGSWSATWQPRNTQAPSTTVSVSAQIPAQNVQGSIQITGGLRQNVDPPQISPGAVLSAASFAQQGVIAPGSIVSIFGARFADGINVANTLPLTTELVGTEVILGGSSLPLFFTSTGQINAIVPISAPVNSQAQMLVRRGTTYTVPEPVTVAAAQPAVFTPSQSGKGQGYALVHALSGTETLADSVHPAHANDVVVIYCAGLGLTNPAVESGTPSSLTTLSPTVNSVTVSMGGQNATVLFAGLAPGYVGLYQVNTIVPAGITPSDQVPLILSVGGQSSPIVTMSVR